MVSTITIQTGNGPVEITAVLVEDVLAVHRRYSGTAETSSSWFITHVPTGLCMPAAFRTKNRALGAARRLAKVDWDRFIQMSLRGERPPEYDDVGLIFEEYGAIEARCDQSVRKKAMKIVRDYAKEQGKS